MTKRVISCVPAVAVGLFATAIMLGTSGATLAADDCLAGPTREPAQGGHWYYRRDQVTNRKCWYLVEPGAQTPTAEAPEPQATADAPPQRGLGSFLSALGFTEPASGPQPDVPTGDPRFVQPTRQDDRQSREAPPARQPRPVLASRQHRPAHLRPPVEHAEERPAERPATSSLDRADRDALFEEFLRWKENQSP